MGGSLTFSHMNYQRAILDVVEVEQIIVILPLEAVVGVSAKGTRKNAQSIGVHAAIMFIPFPTKPTQISERRWFPDQKN